MKKRVFALLLCLLLCLSILPVGAFADDYCEHAIVKMEAKATCGEAHKEHYKCTKCGKLFSDERGEHEISYESVAQAKPVHTSDLSHVDYKDASCTESGNYEYWVCTECGQMFSENPGFEGETDNRRTKPVPDDKVRDYTIEPYGHNLVFHEAVPHTCTQDGNVAYYQCSNCWWSFSDPDGLNPLSSVTDPAAHVKTEYPAVAPTCDTDGSSYYFYCDVCGKYYDENGQEIAEGSWVIPAGHNYVEQPFHEPTCTAAGNRLYYTCSGCDKVFDADLNETTLEAVTLGKIPHSLVIHVPAAAKSCYTDGNVEYWQCASCGAKFADAEGTLPLTDEEVVIPACHEFVATPAKEATCTEPGNIAYWTCTVEGCGIIVDESGAQIWNTVVPATGHKPVKVERSTTCTEAGVAEHYKCEACGRLFLDQACTVEKTLEDLQEAAFGHDFDMDGRCTHCGAISPDTPAFEGMSYVDVPTPQGTWQQVIVRVTAQKGVFPAGSQLSAQIVLNVDSETQEAVDAARGDVAPARAYTFDVKVLNRYGYEVQPSDGSKVNVSFALAEATNKNMNATVYHITEAEDGSKSAEALETSVEEVEGAGGKRAEAVVAETDGFSRFTVEFTCEAEEPYILTGGDSVALETILNKVLKDPNPPFNIIDVTVKDEDKPYFEAVKDDDGVWIVHSYLPFSDEKKMIVKLNDDVWGSIDYIIKVTDANNEVIVTNGLAWIDGQPESGAASEIIAAAGQKVWLKIDPEKVSPDELFYQWRQQSGDPKQVTIDDPTAIETYFMMPDSTSAADIFRFYVDKKYTVTFDKNGHGTTETMPATQYIVPDGTHTAERPTTIPTDPNFVFGDWYEDAACTKLFDFANTKITGNTTVYAKWRCQVTFRTAHGVAPASQIVDINGTAVKPDNLSWIGYKFAGWSPDIKTKITSNTTFDALWTPDFKITKGSGGTAHYGSTYAFTLNYYYHDYLAYKDLFDVAVGRHNSTSATSLKDQYVVTQGADKRVVVTLKASYIRTLTDGATYDIIFDTGLPDPPDDLGATEGTFKVSKSPKTGDESNIALWAAIAGVSLIAVVVIVAVLLNKRKKGKKAPTPPENRPADKTKKPPKE